MTDEAQERLMAWVNRSAPILTGDDGGPSIQDDIRTTIATLTDHLGVMEKAIDSACASLRADYRLDAYNTLKAARSDQS